MKTIKKSFKKAFSLIEMMIVLTVIGLVFAFAAPDLFSLIQSSSLTSEGTYLRNQLTRAQQLALSKNTDVEIRFFKIADAAAAEEEELFRAYQIYQFNYKGELEPVGKFNRINAPIVLSTRLSTLLRPASPDSDEEKYGYVSPQEGTADILKGFNRISDAEYVAFRFRPNGSTDLPSKANSDNWYLTLVQGEGAATNSSPDNYFCLQVNPYNGRISEYRP